MRESVGEMLRALGHERGRGDDGTGGARRWRCAQRFDVVLTDFGMPGMNGVEFAQPLHGVAPKMPVVLMTGWGLDRMTAAAREHRVRAQQAGHA